MKISFLIGKINSGGAERVLTTLANDWTQKHNISIIQLSDIDPFYPLLDSVNLVNIPRRPTGNLFSKFVYNIKTIFILRKAMKELDSDVFISFIVGLNIYSIIAAKLARKKIIACEHNNHKAYKGWLNRTLRILLYRIADHVTILTKYDFDYYKNYTSNITIVNNPLSFIPFEKIVPRDKIILCVGSLGEQKNFDHIIESVALIKNQMEGWKVHVLGDGKLRAYLQTKIENLGLTHLIQLEGVQKNVLSWYQRSSIFVLCSLYEGFPMVLTEAMSQGLACISYNIISGPNEIITHEKDGLLIPSQDIKALSESILNLISDEEKRLLLGQEAAKSSKSLELKNINKIWEKIINAVS